jgi:hypothetical protein
VGNAPKEDNLSMTEWTRLKASPYDERLQLIRVSGNVSEFETPLGYRYRCVKENSAKQWFSFRKNQHMKRVTRAEVKICCKKLQREFGTFIDRANGPGRPVCIFPKSSGLTSRLSCGIHFCPWCGKELQFLGESEETGKTQARLAAAGGRNGR